MKHISTLKNSQPVSNLSVSQFLEAQKGYTLVEWEPWGKNLALSGTNFLKWRWPNPPICVDLAAMSPTK